MEYIAILSTLAVSVTLLMSGILKVIDLHTTTRMLVRMRILPDWIMKIIGIFLPFLEIIFGTFLLLFYIPIWVKVCVLFLLLSFFVVSIYSLVTQQEIPCNCFGRLMEGGLGFGSTLHSFLLIIYSLPMFFSQRLTYISFIVSNDSFGNFLMLFVVGTLVYTGLLIRLNEFHINRSR